MLNVSTRAPWLLAGSDAGQHEALRAAFAQCDGLTRAHSKSFYLATVFLPGQTRSAIRSFYAFCRATDDIVDAPHRSCFRGNLAQWRIQSRRAWHEQMDPVLMAWSYSRDQFSVPTNIVEELVDGCEMDLRVTRYETWAMLRTYCYHVASTVGLVSMHIIGLESQDEATQHLARERAIDLGVALQLTNILRDVGEDLARGRIYIPLEDLARFGLDERDLADHLLDQRFCRLMQFEIERAHGLYEAGLRGIALLKPSGRLAVTAAAQLYRGILDRIQRNNYQVFTKRASLSAGEKLVRLPAIYRQVRQMQ